MKTLVVIVLCLLLPAASWGAAADSSATGRPNSLRAGAWAMQFDVNGQLISMDSFSGGVSLKRHGSPKSAFRFGVGFTAGSSTTGQTAAVDREIGMDDYGVSIEVIYQRYVNPDASVNLYWGVGPYVQWYDETLEAVEDSLVRTDSTTEWGAGGQGMLGVEWFATRDFSLHAEYTASGGYYSRERESSAERPGQPGDMYKSTLDGWSVGIRNYVRFGLSVYF